MMNPQEFENIDRVERQFWWFRGMNRILFHFLEREFSQHPPRRVLETGCGTGGFAQLLHQRWPVEVHATDLALEGLQFAQGRGLPALAAADIRALPYATGTFDAVLSLDVIVHLEQGKDHAAFQELARVLRPGGLAIIRVSALDILHSRHSTYTFEHQRFTKTRLLERVTSTGLHPEHCTYLNTLLMPIALAKFRLWEPLFASEPETGLTMPPRWLNEALAKALDLEHAAISRGLNFPLGQSLLVLARKPKI